jgi:small GTP-binding protein
MMSKYHSNKPTPIKILIVGDSGVGKSSILLRYTSETFTTNYIATIGIDFKLKKIVIDGKDYKLQIWDSAGQERFLSLTRNYFRGAMGIVVVYDVTRGETFEMITKWMYDINSYCDTSIPVVLVGNKIDMKGERVISSREGRELAEMFKVFFFECSSKDGTNIEEIFDYISKEIVTTQKYTPALSDEKTNITDLNQPDNECNESSKRCC